MKILKINLLKLHNEEHFQFHNEVSSQILKNGAKVLGIEQEFEQYSTLLTKEFDALQPVRKSVNTDRLSEADALRDELFRGLCDMVKASLVHYDADKKLAAQQYQVYLSQLGNVARKSFNDETTALAKLIMESQTTYASEIATLGLGEWLSRLDARNQDFDKLMKLRFTEDATKSDISMRDARLALDAQYRVLTTKIDALIVVNGGEAYAGFVEELNARVEKYNSIIALRGGSSSKEKKDE